MPMHNPPHPGEFIREVYLGSNDITGRQLATKPVVYPSTLSRVLQGTSGISPEMAYVSPRLWGGLRRAGWLCSTITTFGGRVRPSISVQRSALINELVAAPGMRTGEKLLREGCSIQARLHRDLPFLRRAPVESLTAARDGQYLPAGPRR